MNLLKKILRNILISKTTRFTMIEGNGIYYLLGSTSLSWRTIPWLTLYRDGILVWAAFLSGLVFCIRSVIAITSPSSFVAQEVFSMLKFFPCFLWANQKKKKKYDFIKSDIHLTLKWDFIPFTSQHYIFSSPLTVLVIF